MEYIIVVAEGGIDLMEKVNKRLAEGYILRGDIVMKGSFIYQVMVNFSGEDNDNA